MKIEIDMDEFYDSYGGETMDEAIGVELREQVMKIVKKDPKYKAYVNKKAMDVLDGMKI